MKLINLFEMKYNLGIPKIGKDTDLTQYMIKNKEMFGGYADIVIEINKNRECDFGNLEIFYVIRALGYLSSLDAIKYILLEDRIRSINDERVKYIPIEGDLEISSPPPPPSSEEEGESDLEFSSSDEEEEEEEEERLSEFEDVPHTETSWILYYLYGNVSMSLTDLVMSVKDDKDLLQTVFASGIRATNKNILHFPKAIEKGQMYSDNNSMVSGLVVYNKKLVSSYADKPVINFWDDKGTLVHSIQTTAGIMELVAIDDMLISIDFYGMIQSWNEFGENVKSIKSSASRIFVIADQLYVNTGTGIFQVTGKELIPVKKMDMMNTTTCLIKWQNMLVCGSSDGEVKCCYLEPPHTVVRHFHEQSGTISSLAIYDKYLLSGSSSSFDRTMKMWDINKSESIKTFKHKRGVKSILVVDRFIFSSDIDGFIYVWLNDGTLVQYISAHCSHTHLVVYNDHIYSASGDSSIIKWSFDYLKARRQALRALSLINTMPPKTYEVFLTVHILDNPENVLTYKQLDSIYAYVASRQGLSKSEFIDKIFFPVTDS